MAIAASHPGFCDQLYRFNGNISISLVIYDYVQSGSKNDVFHDKLNSKWFKLRVLRNHVRIRYRFVYRFCQHGFRNYNFLRRQQLYRDEIFADIVSWSDSCKAVVRSHSGYYRKSSDRYCAYVYYLVWLVLLYHIVYLYVYQYGFIQWALHHRGYV